MRLIPLALLVATLVVLAYGMVPRSQEQPAGYPVEITQGAGYNGPVGIPVSATPATLPSAAPAAPRPRPASASATLPRATTKPRVTPKPAVRVTQRPKGIQYAVRATWYCGAGSRCSRGYPAGGMYAAISPDLRTWRGHLVRACAGGRCVVVRVIDCNCQAEHGIDLYAVAFRQLAPLSAGVITVTLELL